MKSNDNFLGMRDIVLMNVVAILSLRQIPNVAVYGASSMILWILAACCLFVPLAFVCGELATGWPKNGGIFVWVKEAFGHRAGWFIVICFLFSCVLFFPLMLQFGVSAIAFVISPELSEDKSFVGILSIIIFWILAYMNMRGLKWTKIINNLSAWLGVFLPAAIIVLLALIWLLIGRPMSTNYLNFENWIPDLTQWDNIVFLSSMMFAFAGLEVSAMIAGQTKNPQKDFPRAMLVSAVVIVGIYMIGTFSINTLFPAEETNIVTGIMQAIGAASEYLGIPGLLSIIAICMFIGVLGQVNSWLVGPIYMLQEASREDNLLGDKISSLDPKYNTPVYAIKIEALVVTVLCFSTFISPSVAAAYWTLTALTTIDYFIPYLFMFAAYVVLRKKKPDVYRAFKIPGILLPVLMPLLGFLSIAFAVFLVFIPPAQVDLGNYGIYLGQMLGGIVLALFISEYTYKRAQKRKAILKKGE